MGVSSFIVQASGGIGATTFIVTTRCRIQLWFICFHAVTNTVVISVVMHLVECYGVFFYSFKCYSQASFNVII